MSEINRSEAVVEALGKPIEDGLLVIPNIEISGPRRMVNFNVSVSGPKSDGTLYVNSYRDGFRSDFHAYVETGGKKIEIHRGQYPCKDE